jgi:hypothetical protein
MVDVAATVELDGLLQRDNGRHVTLLLSLLQLVNAHVEVGDVGLVVLAVVGLHDLRGDHGLKGTVVEVHRGENEGGHASLAHGHSGGSNNSLHDSSAVAQRKI